MTPPRFTCPLCGAVSYNPHDIRERYCGRCHLFVEEGMAATPLILGEVQRQALAQLRELGDANPVDMLPLLERLKTPEGKAAHMRQMTAQTIPIPAAFLVTYSLELRHPAGTCRHLSVSVERPRRVPSPEAVWMLAVELGFTGTFESCYAYPEDLQRGAGRAIAVNIIQPITHGTA
jgi:hypothetical protein